MVQNNLSKQNRTVWGERALVLKRSRQDGAKLQTCSACSSGAMDVILRVLGRLGLYDQLDS